MQYPEIIGLAAMRISGVIKRKKEKQKGRYC